MTPLDPNASGWYPDPAGVHHQRYWSGDGWTARVADAYGVAAAHHVEQAFAPPGGGPPRVAPAPAKPATPSLSLVEPIREPPEEPAAEEGAPPPDRPRPPGWYPDPSGIHCERSWDGNGWSEVAVDRNGAVLTHAVVGSFSPPTRDASPRVPSPAPPPAALPWGFDDGWQSDAVGRFRERYFVAGQPSEVVRTARYRTG